MKYSLYFDRVVLKYLKVLESTWNHLKLLYTTMHYSLLTAGVLDATVKAAMELKGGKGRLVGFSWIKLD